MLSMIEQEKKVSLLKCYFLYVFYDGPRENTHSVITLFFYAVYDGETEKTHSVLLFLFLCCL